MKTQEQENKKAYEAPLAEPVALDDEALDAAAGGFEMYMSEDGKELIVNMDDEDLRGDGYPVYTEYEKANDMMLRTDGSGKTGRGRGGSCDGVAYHKVTRTFSGGRNPQCVG